jgi:hypothetical protein
MHEDRPPDEQPPVRHTDLTKIDGYPSPEAEQAYILQRSDIEVERTRHGFKIRAHFTGHGVSPINVTLAQTINLASAAGTGTLAQYLHAPVGGVIGIAAGTWIVGTALIVGAMRLIGTKGNKKN